MTTVRTIATGSLQDEESPTVSESYRVIASEIYSIAPLEIITKILVLSVPVTHQSLTISCSYQQVPVVQYPEAISWVLSLNNVYYPVAISVFQSPDSVQCPVAISGFQSDGVETIT